MDFGGHKGCTNGAGGPKTYAPPDLSYIPLEHEHAERDGERVGITGLPLSQHVSASYVAMNLKWLPA